jgi:hypothetical protein
LEDEISSSDTKQINMAKNLAGHTEYLCWKIWLARNDQIFNNILHSPLMVAIKDKTLLLETVTYHPLKNKISLLPKENNWLGDFITQNRKKINARPLGTPG